MLASQRSISREDPGGRWNGVGGSRDGMGSWADRTQLKLEMTSGDTT